MYYTMNGYAIYESDDDVLYELAEFVGEKTICIIQA